MDAKATMHMDNLPRETQFKNPIAIKDILGLRIVQSKNLINSYYGIWARETITLIF